MAPARQRLILFTRYPIAGRTKTRLIPGLGAEGAARLQGEMTAHMVHTARVLAIRQNVQIEIRFEGAALRDMRRWLGAKLRFQHQGPGDLGQRLQRAFARAFSDGRDRVVVMGADCPSLDLSTLEEAFTALENADVVLGPASDGGYYLLGLNRAAPGLFNGIAWGTNDVLARTLERVRHEALRPVLLPEFTDVDRPEDLPVWERARCRASTLAVIIPALNEADLLKATLQAVAAGQPDEIIVADGGSTDSTCDVARRCGAAVVQCAPGRARQMNTAAAQAHSAQLLFLHADTLPPQGYRGLIQQTLDQPAASAGAFGFALREAVPYRRWIERSVSARCQLFKTPFGDQGLFLRRSLFEAVGGFPDWPILEDVEIVRRLKAHGKIRIEQTAALTSGRRWLTRGNWKTFWINQLVLLGHTCGISNERLARLYRSPDLPPPKRFR